MPAALPTPLKLRKCYNSFAMLVRSGCPARPAILSGLLAPRISTTWCSEIGSSDVTVFSTDELESSDVREPISLHQAVLRAAVQITETYAEL